MVKQRPFRSPHHTISDAALIEGGAGVPRPGEVTFAHHGILFLDELPEFPRERAGDVAAAPGGPLRDYRPIESVRMLPANFTLIASLKSL
jgi:magnesium chelatase family protein